MLATKLETTFPFNVIDVDKNAAALNERVRSAPPVAEARAS